MAAKTKNNKKSADDNVDLFLHALGLWVDRAQADFESAKQKFTERAALDPHDAIEWHGRHVVATQRAALAWRAIRRFVTDEVGPGLKFATRREAIQFVLSDVKDGLVRGAVAGQSTCGIANGVDRASLEGLNSVISGLEYLVNHESIDA